MKFAISNRHRDASLPTRIHFLSSPVSQFALASLVGSVFLLVGSIILIGSRGDGSYSIAFGLIAYLMAALWAGNRLVNDFPHLQLGLCNIATLGRLVVVGILFVALLEAVQPSWFIFMLAVFALSLDGVDGWLARKQGLTSEFGARFDVEVDAMFALVLAALAAMNAAAVAFVLLLGLPYYVFAVARIFAPWLSKPLPDKFSRKVICVFQIATLIALQVPVLTDGRLNLVVFAAAAALVWSFGRDILWLWRASK